VLSETRLFTVEGVPASTRDLFPLTSLTTTTTIEISNDKTLMELAFPDSIAPQLDVMWFLNEEDKKENHLENSL